MGLQQGVSRDVPPGIPAASLWWFSKVFWHWCKQLEGKKHTALCITEMCHSIMGSHCRGQSSTWVGQLIWGPHLPPPPKDRIPSCARTTALSKIPGGILGLSIVACAPFCLSAFPHFSSTLGWGGQIVPHHPSPPHPTRLTRRWWVGAHQGHPATRLLNQPCHPWAAGATHLTFLCTSSLGFPQYNGAH